MIAVKALMYGEQTSGLHGCAYIATVDGTIIDTVTHSRSGKPDPKLSSRPWMAASGLSDDAYALACMHVSGYDVT